MIPSQQQEFLLCIHPDTGFYFVPGTPLFRLSTSGTSLAAYPSVVQLRLETVAVPHRSLHRIKQTSRQSVKRTYACVAAMAHFLLVASIWTWAAAGRWRAAAGAAPPVSSSRRDEADAPSLCRGNYALRQWSHSAVL